jgi:hypothetical protein
MLSGFRILILAAKSTFQFRPAAQEGIKALMERGVHKPGDFENRLGDCLRQIVPWPGGVGIEETARLDESYTPIPPKHLASCQIEGSR